MLQSLFSLQLLLLDQLLFLENVVGVLRGFKLIDARFYCVMVIIIFGRC